MGRPTDFNFLFVFEADQKKESGGGGAGAPSSSGKKSKCEFVPQMHKVGWQGEGRGEIAG